MPASVATVAIFGMLTFLAMLFMAHRSRMAKIHAQSGGADVARLERIIAENAAETQKLRDRVAILEKLVTDDDRKLAYEIEALRRAQVPEARG